MFLLLVTTIYAKQLLAFMGHNSQLYVQQKSESG